MYSTKRYMPAMPPTGKLRIGSREGGHRMSPVADLPLVTIVSPRMVNAASLALVAGCCTMT